MSDIHWADRIYNRLIGRDISYIATGGFIILTYQWAWLNEITILKGNLQTSIAYLFAAYLLGLSVSEFFSIIKVAPKDTGITDIQLGSLFENFNHELPYVLFERTVALMHVGAAICGSSAVSSLILILRLIKYHYLCTQQVLVLVICLVTFGLSILYTRRKHTKVLEDIQFLREPTHQL